jgi:hypothetical protein
VQLKRNAALLDKAVATKETRFAARALRQARAQPKRPCLSLLAALRAAAPPGARCSPAHRRMRSRRARRCRLRRA